jgi:hypothetical protein
MGPSTRVRIGVQFPARFAFKSFKDPILYLTTITIVRLHSSANQIRNYLVRHLWQKIVRRFVRKISRVDGLYAGMHAGGSVAQAIAR